MTDPEKKTLLSRANHEYAEAFIEKYKLEGYVQKDGEWILFETALVQFAMEVIVPREQEKESGNQHH